MCALLKFWLCFQNRNRNSWISKKKPICIAECLGSYFLFNLDLVSVCFAFPSLLPLLWVIK